MSTSPHPPVQPLDASLQPSRAAPVTERTSLRSEYRETIRRLLQHTVFALLLAIRLYMLPLLYISHKLSVRDDPWYPTIRNLVLRPGRTLANCHRCRQRNNGNVKIWNAWTSVRDGLFVPVRIFKSLYTLGRMIGEVPNALPPCPFPQLMNRGTASDIEGPGKGDGTVGDQGTESTDSALEAPASASQIYHAALLSSSTLDELLAAFEADRDNRVMGSDHLVIRRGRDAWLSAGSLDVTGRRGRQQYRTLSVRSTPEAVLAAGKAHESLCGRGAHSCPREFQLQKTPDRRANACQTQFQSDNQSPKNSPELHTSPCTRDLPEARQPDGELDAGGLDRCPTFVRRHAQSRLPKRSMTGDKQAFAMLKERGAVSTPELPVSPPTPTKRVRLQRRVRPRKDIVKASND
ncbi:hypothetical protein CLAIMM_02065 [Cladophialophora immunda]|nr:hypothetical protein CLAIMM_02065 [Cladophialophora immunda]